MNGKTTAAANPPRVTIWEADGSPWHGAGYGCEIRRRLRARGFSVRAVPIQQRRPTDDELTSEVHILSGGTTSATTSDGWVGSTRPPLQEILDGALVGTKTVVGICFGAQLLAVALAGTGAVRPARQGMEVGLHRVRSTRSSESHVVCEFHHHEVRPEAIRDIGATVTFENDHTYVQGFAIGSGVLGFQFHPELDPWRAASTVRANRRVIRSVGSCPRQAMRTIRAHRGDWHPRSFERLVVDHLHSQWAPQPSLAA